MYVSTRSVVRPVIDVAVAAQAVLGLVILGATVVDLTARIVPNILPAINGAACGVGSLAESAWGSVSSLWSSTPQVATVHQMTAAEIEAAYAALHPKRFDDFAPSRHAAPHYAAADAASTAAYAAE